MEKYRNIQIQLDEVTNQTRTDEKAKFLKYLLAMTRLEAARLADIEEQILLDYGL